ncbi:site-specific integrase [Pseudomonas oryzihabitans]|uniref:site-specific integrase n=1 Tax=Pseudomonas oryzihabitans TaxID=47885 RepID=UPI0011A2714C|nr:tyrosine-type recombinase/integrase [Pseudomonas oryzihabitans]
MTDLVTLPSSSGITRANMLTPYRRFMSGFQGSSAVTMRYALAQVAAAVGFPEDEPLDELPWEVLRDVHLGMARDVWTEQGLARNTIVLYMHAMRAMCNACFLSELISEKDMMRIKAVKLPRGKNMIGRGRFVELRYREQLIKNCLDDERLQGVRDAALIAVLFGSGMRRAEAAVIRCEDLNLDEGYVDVVAKGNQRVRKYLAAWSLPFLEQWQAARYARLLTRTGYLFSRISKAGKVGETALTGRSVYFLLRQRSEMAGLPFLVKPHDARRTVGTSVIAEHGDIAAQKVLGHASLSTTAIYDMRGEEFKKSIVKNMR